MKKILFLSVAATLICSISFAKIWRVNNNVGVSADFTSAQQAHNDANVLAGDTLYFEPAANSYGSLLMAKGLKLIGAGYFLSQNPGLQYSTSVTYLENITLRPTAVNSVISVSCINISDSANNLVITRCRTNSIEFVAASNCTVANCHINGIVFKAAFTGVPTCNVFGCSGMSIYNNISTSSIAQQALGYLPFQFGGCGSNWVTPHSVTAFNNSITGSLIITGFAYNNICQNIQTDGNSGVSNNIFHTSRSGGNTRITFLPGTNQSSDSLEAGNGNQFSIDISTIYTSGYPNSFSDTAWRLKPGSPAIGTGAAGVNCGATGGSTPYVGGVLPAIPSIYKLNVQPVPSGNSLGVTISTRSNN